MQHRTWPYGTKKNVMGPGRSGAVASVYVSHYLGAIWLPPTMGKLPSMLRPLLVIDTASRTGATIRKIANRFEAEYQIVLFEEPPLVKFFYELRDEEGGSHVDR